jgi:exopolysaccharide biosynthesis polyprenyl glycosylphosphotransferase
MTELIESPVRGDSLAPPARSFAARPVVRPGVPDAKPTVASALPEQPKPRWCRTYIAQLVLVDLVLTSIAVTIGYFLRFSTESVVQGREYAVLGGLIAATWIATIAQSGGYEVRHLSAGAEEFKRVTRATAVLAGLIAFVCYLLKYPLARGFVAGAIPIGLVLLLGGRYLLRQHVKRVRKRGGWTYRILAVGDRESVDDLIRAAHLSPWSGLRVVAACVNDASDGVTLRSGVRVLGSVTRAVDVAAEIDADILAVASTRALGSRQIRELGWALEGTGRDLVMAPGLTEVAGPRVHISPVEGLPLVWVDQPEFTGVKRLVKLAVDLIGAALLLAVASPVLLLAALAVKLTSRGPVFFRQRRLGAHGTEFSVYKFRTMVTDAHAQRAGLLRHNIQDGALFKIRQDPRITGVGRFLRQFSIDELPQLFNVLRGEMSLVGPRPLASEDSDYGGHARRRLLVKPGITGLWQVSGRSDLSWEDAVRLDLYYVENWSLAFDLVIALRTVAAVLRRQGAY